MLKRKPYLAKLYPFGTRCYVHNKDRNLKKLDERGWPARLVGYEDYGRGYRVWYEDTNEITSSKDVRFLKQSAFDDSQSEEREREPEQEVEEQPSTDHSSTSIKEPESQNPVSARLRDRSKLKKPDRYEAGLAQSTSTDEPLNFEEAMNSVHKKQWLEAMEAEMRSMKELDVWDLVKPDPARKAIGCRWVYKVKTKENGAIDKFRARLVLKGYSQRKGIDYTELFAPVARLDSVRLLMSIAVEEQLVTHSFDVRTAFLHAPLSEFIQMEQAPGFEDGTGRVCRLKKALYGLKQAPRAFHQRFKEILLGLNLTQCDSDPCVFQRKDTQRLIIAVYVDDGLILASTSKLVTETLNQLKQKLEITSQPLNYFLGIQFKAMPDGGIFMYQQKYIEEVVKRFGMENAKPVATPMDNAIYSNELDKEPRQEYPFRELVGSLSYIAISTRFDIAFAVGYLSRYLDKYTSKHWIAGLRVVRYLLGTSSMGLHFRQKADYDIQAFSDSDFASDTETRRSTSGEIFKRCHAAVTWGSNRQTIVTLSSCEAELLASCSAAKTALWLKQFLHELGYEVTPVIGIDNQSTIRLIENSQFHKRTKHIEVKYHFCREKVEQGKIKVKYVPTELNEADILTKPLAKPTFQRLRSLSGLSACPK